MIDIPKYLAKSYTWPPCWELVTDVYLNELGFSFTGTDIQGKTVKQLQSAFLRSIFVDKLFRMIDSPEDGCIVLMYRHGEDVPNHCGVYYRGNVLHALQTMPIYQDLYSLKDSYKQLKYGVLK